MNNVTNPFVVLTLLNRIEWLQFFVAFVAWTWDAFDFFTVSMTISDLATTFDKTKTDITWGITLVLMLRSVGAVLFGIASDRWGRKWPFVLNNLLFIVLELATGFCQTYTQFLWIRALFGIAMGGLYGNVAATALEDCPLAARGVISGMMQQGYAFGYLLAVVCARLLVNTTSYGWRPLFWFGACPPVLIIIFRLCLPETKVFQERQRVREASQNTTRTFIAEGKIALKRHWLLLCYMVLLTAGFNFMVRSFVRLILRVLLLIMLILHVNTVSWFAGLVSDYAAEPIRFQPEPGHCDSSRGQPWRNLRRYDRGLVLAGLWPSLDNPHHDSHRCCALVPVLLPRQ